MSAISVTFGRTVGMARNLYSTALSIGGFLAGAAIMFAFNLEGEEGSTTSIAKIWAESVSPILPVLAAFLAMDSWSDERHTGRIDMLLASPVEEIDLVIGKFFGVFFMTIFAAILSLVMSMFCLSYFTPVSINVSGWLDFVPAIVALTIQGALWCATSVAMSAFFCHAAASACASLVVTVAIPRGLWMAFIAWSLGSISSMGTMPIDEHAQDIASGLINPGVMISYLILTVSMLFIATKSIESMRVKGRGALKTRFKTVLLSSLSLVLSVLLIMLAVRLSPTFDWRFSGEARFSERTAKVLSESRGDITITAFLSRNNVKFRETSQFLRALKAESESRAGANLTLRYVDPRIDIGQAERLVRKQAQEGSIIFENVREFISVPISKGIDERQIASAISRLNKPIQRRTIYWTQGHGEISHRAFGPWGLSDIARELSYDGYRNQQIDLANLPRGKSEIPGDAALLIVAGAKTDFALAEVQHIERYLRKGGRLLVLLSSAEGGLSSMLPSWGVRALKTEVDSERTLSGSDVIVDDFSGHVITEQLRGTQIVLEHPIAFARSAVADFDGAADKIEFSPLANVGTSVVAAAIERGSTIGNDLAIRPTRIVVVGDTSFIVNGQLEVRKNANGDFFMNAISYLAGSDTIGGSSLKWNQLVTGFDRRTRIKFAIGSAVLAPGAVFLLLVLFVLRRRHRK